MFNVSIREHFSVLNVLIVCIRNTAMFKLIVEFACGINIGSTLNIDHSQFEISPPKHLYNKTIASTSNFLRLEKVK